ncbi:glycosyltransferase [Trebonia sp.]|uniref:glycosyltransferase family 2 protein n=1 Tax=Trebonia sp. TaxID=2767075 RepID=UPI00262AA8C6|nr:glycosyltransferase [Trebonia sp.]
MVAVPTRGDAASATRISENIVGRLDGIPVIVVRNRCVPAETDTDWANLAQRPNVQIIDRFGGGAARARNAAISTATSRTVVFVDDDVRVSESALRTLVARQRSASAAIATARVVAANTAHHQLFDADLGFDRGSDDGTWMVGQSKPLSPLNVWQFGVGATFAIDLSLLGSKGNAIRFDERLSNGRFCGGSEDIDFFYAAYLNGHIVSYVAEAVVEHIFPISAAEVSAKCRQYALSDGAFYTKWAQHVSAADIRGEIAGWLRRLGGSIANRSRGRPAVPILDLLAEPLYKLMGGATWELLLRQSC